MNNEQNPSTNGEGQSKTEATPAAPQVRRKSRWGRRIFGGLLVLLLLIAGLIAAAPWLISSERGRTFALGLVNERLRGSVAMDSLAVSWNSPIEIRGLRVLDPDNREVLNVASVRHPRGLIELIRSGLSFGEIVIESPTVHLIMNDANDLSIARAFESRTPAQPSSGSGTIPDLRGTLSIRNAKILAQRSGAAAFEVSSLDFNAVFDTLADIKTKLDMKLKDGAQVTGDATITGLVTAGRITPESIAGTVNLSTDGAIDLGPLSRFIAPDAAVDGKLKIQALAKTDAGNVRADFSIDVAGLRSASQAGSKIAPLDLRLAGNAERIGEELRAATKFSGQAGEIDATLRYKLSDRLPELSGDRILAALFGGENLTLPDFQLESRGEIDLAKLGQAVPGVMRVQADREITGGRFVISKLVASGGREPAATVAMQVSSLSAVAAGRAVQVQPISLDIDAKLPVGKGLNLASGTLASSFVNLKANGTAADLKADLRGSFERLQQDLGQVFDLSGLKLGGEFAIDARFACPAAGKPIRSTGQLKVSRLTYAGRAALDGDADVSWTDLDVMADGSAINAVAAKVSSSAVNVDIKTLKMQTVPALQVSADVDATAELSRLFRAVGALAEMQKPPAIGGALALTTRIVTSGNEVTVAGRGGVDNFVAGEGSGAVREPRLDLDFDANLDSAKDVLTLTKTQVRSSPLTLQLSGVVSEMSKSQALRVTGQYDASWEQISKILHELAPATADLVIVRGKSQSTFELVGAANTAGAVPAFKGLSTALDIGWQSADLVGAQMKAATLRPALKDGVLTIPARAIPTEGGNVNLGGVVDFTAADATLRMPGTTKLLENVAVTPRLARSLLSRINPVFNKVVRAEGKVNLHVTDIAFPMGETVKTAAAGKGFLDLGSLQIQPADFMSLLLEVLGYPTQDMVLVQFGKLDFLVQNGRVKYDNFTMVFPENVDLRFRGSIGFDDTLDLWVSVPVKEALLKRMGVKEPALSYARKLTGLRIDLPIAGTRENPQLDFSKVDVAKLVQEILLKGGAEKGLEEGLGGLLKGISGGEEKEAEKSDGQKRPRDRRREREKP